MSILPILNAALLGTALCVITVSARAQPGEPISPEAKPLYTAAMLAKSKKAWRGCYENAAAAWRIQKHTDIAGTLGECALELGKSVEAARHLRSFIEDFNVSQDRVRVAQQLLDRAKLSIATVLLSTTPKGAEITVDGNVVKYVSRQLFLEPGSHTFRAKWDGHQSATITKNLQRGAEEQISLELSPKHKQGGVNPAIAGVLGGGTGITLVGAIVFTALAASKTSEADEQLAELHGREGVASCQGTLPPAGCSEQFKLRGERDTLVGARNGAFIVFGAVAAATATYVVVSIALADDPKDAATLQLYPTIGGATLDYSW